MEKPLLVLAEVGSILEALGINYVLVGSLASSMHGVSRATADIDILADVKPNQVEPLLNALQDSFYVDELVVREAIEDRKSFNAIHFDSVFKVDIFIPRGDDFSKKQLERRQPRSISPDTGQKIYVATAEDTILAKLRWYREDKEVSDTQWSDVLGIIGSAEKPLDLEYLNEWATKLGVLDLLEKAVQEAN